MNGDRELQRSVIDELGWEPGVKAAEIGVSVKDGVVTLTGNVDSYPEKRVAGKPRAGGVPSGAATFTGPE